MSLICTFMLKVCLMFFGYVKTDLVFIHLELIRNRFQIFNRQHYRYLVLCKQSTGDLNFHRDTDLKWPLSLLEMLDIEPLNIYKVILLRSSRINRTDSNLVCPRNNCFCLTCVDPNPPFCIWPETEIPR